MGCVRGRKMQVRLAAREPWSRRRPRRQLIAAEQRHPTAARGGRLRDRRQAPVKRTAMRLGCRIAEEPLRNGWTAAVPMLSSGVEQR